jgi:hypothetical protein
VTASGRFEDDGETNAMGDQQKQGGQDRNQGNQNPRNQQAQQGDQDKGRMGNKPGMGPKPGQRSDDELVGRDTDGDGKVVQPGQRPGQSHGTGHIDKDK